MEIDIDMLRRDYGQSARVVGMWNVDGDCETMAVHTDYLPNDRLFYGQVTDAGEFIAAGIVSREMVREQVQAISMTERN